MFNTDRLNDVRETAADCKECDLHKGRVQSVFSKGNINSGLFICGMVPGNDENNKNNTEGNPFIGKAGRLLDDILKDVGLYDDSYSKVYITNMCKCGLKPSISLDRKWIDSCMPYLMCELYLGKPKIMVMLGKDSLFGLMNINPADSLKKHVGVIYKHPCFLVIGTYHPSFFIRGGGKNHVNYKDTLQHFKIASHIVNDD
jgi:DNA polymerase